MIFIMNPPFSCQGKTNSRASKVKLDRKIFKKVVEEYPDAEAIAIMQSSNDQARNCGFTDISEEYKFEDVSVKVKIFERNPNKPELKIMPKFEANGLYTWIEQHKVNNNLRKYFIEGCGLDEDHRVPEDCLAIVGKYTPRPNQKFRYFFPGDIVTRFNSNKWFMTYYLFRTTEPKKLAKYLDGYTDLLNEYLTYGNVNTRSLYKCIPVREDLELIKP